MAVRRDEARARAQAEEDAKMAFYELRAMQRDRQLVQVGGEGRGGGVTAAASAVGVRAVFV